MVQRKRIIRGSFMGETRAVVMSRDTDALIKKYPEMNSYGKKATYDELRARGLTKQANQLRYGRATKPTTSRPVQFGLRIPRSQLGRFGFRI